LYALCARHHHLKHEAGWRYEPLPDGDLLWTAPTGHTYRRSAATYPDALSIAARPPARPPAPPPPPPPRGDQRSERPPLPGDPPPF
jgi:hypothetical protein